MLRLGTDQLANSSYLLDATTATASFSDSALPMGQVFTDASAGSGITITPVTLSAQSAVIVVGVGSEACVPAAPTVTTSPSQSDWVAPGTPVTYTVTMVNNDSTSCEPASFALQHDAAAEWSATFGESSVTVAPGGTASTTFVVASPVSAPDGFYTINVSAAAQSGPAGSASVTYAVATPGPTSEPTMSVTANVAAAFVSRGRKTRLYASALLDGAPVVRGRVTFTILRPDGKTIRRTPFTNKYGNATAVWKPTRRDPKGLYTLTTVAVKDGVEGSASPITFEVR
jgi:hypothetical protein